MGKRNMSELLGICDMINNGRGCTPAFMYRSLQHLSLRHQTYIPENVDISRHKACFPYIQDIPVIKTIISKNVYETTVWVYRSHIPFGNKKK
jgi:hypothetical protein